MSTFEWNKYIINKEAIGKGAYAKVYYGYHKHTKRDIALKKILFTKLPANVKDKVISEIHILQSMTHMHIMGLYEYRFDGDYLVLVTEYCNEGDLEKWLKQEHDFKERMDIMVQIMRGMNYLHQHNILHRDIKPKNILLHDGIIKICDFGFSTMIKEYNQLFNTICGTPLYMSPELLFMQPYTLKSDIWALGILFYIIMYKSHPFGKLINMEDYRLKIKFPIHYPIEDINVINVINVIKQMLSYQPENRPDATIILNALEGHIENELIELSELKEELNYEFPEIVEINLEKVERQLEKKEVDKVEIEIEKVEIEKVEIEKVEIEKVEIEKVEIEKVEIEKVEIDKDKRIIELEEHVFKLETMIKERDNKYISCCFNSDDTDDVTGRGRTNMGYEKDYQNVDMDYFTPPSTSSIPINIPKKAHSLSSTPSESSSKGSLSSSFGTFFSMLTKSFSK
jgi:serine/threonine protein kinase